MATHFTFISDSESATDQFGALCAGSVHDGLTIALSGQLGSGKTRFVRAFCAGLGIDPALVTSPTFVLMQLYRGERWTVSHFDTYRLADADEFLALGADDYLNDAECICLIEWADRVFDILPPDHLTVSIRQTGATQRTFDLSSTGPTSEALLAAIAQESRGT